MVKKTVTISIDVDVYLEIQTKKAAGEEINISEICNDVLKELSEGKEETNLSRLEEEKKSIEIRLEALKRKKSIAQARIMKIKNKDEKEQEALIDKKLRMGQALKNARVADDD